MWSLYVKVEEEVLRLWTNQSASDFKRIVGEVLPRGNFRRILIKPNWVQHQQSPHFPVSALVTNTDLVASVIRECLVRYPNVEWITVGDVPLQNCEWDLLMQQTRMHDVIREFANNPKVRIRDLRRERFRTRDGFHENDTDGDFGDPCGYREVLLDDASFLEPVSDNSNSFRVSDYSPKETTSSHHRGYHRYLIAGSALEADLIVNLPKMKTHQKAGITGALKNLVGINGQKAFLVHYQNGKPGSGGDEFPAQGSELILIQTRVREVLQKRSRILFKLMRPGWRILKRFAGIETVGTPENLGKQNFYVSSGAWYGNDTIWRMVYDLNRIVRFAPAAGGYLKPTEQRTIIAIMDGVIAGEGNGPLQPLPVESGVVITGENPFLVDMAACYFMGFDPMKIPSTSHYKEFADSDWCDFDLEQLEFIIDSKSVRGLDNVATPRTFVASPGWRGHVEKEQVMVQR